MSSNLPAHDLGDHMISVLRNKYGMRFEDVIFCSEPQKYTPRHLLVHFSQARNSIPGFMPRKTPVINLKSDPAVIFSKLSSNTRYKIRRAEREGVVGTFLSEISDGNLTRFIEHYNLFASQKDLPLANRDKLTKLMDAKSLIITEARNSKGALIVSHAYIADRESSRVRLLYSASHYRAIVDSEDRNFVGRANRFLHWYEIMEAAKAGYETYDLGGVPSTTQNQEKNDIARFKGEFGGEIITEYSGYLSSHPLVKLSIPAIQRIFA